MSHKAVFLDRDDTLIKDPGYISRPEQVQFFDEVPKSLARLRDMGYKLVVISNQSGIARGYFTEEDLAQVHLRLEQVLLENGVKLDAIYFSPYLPDAAVEKYRRDTDCRKPKPGMLLRAAKELDINLRSSWMIGDSMRDIEAGQRAGCKTILLDRKFQDSKCLFEGQSWPDYVIRDMTGAVDIITSVDRAAP